MVISGAQVDTEILISLIDPHINKVNISHLGYICILSTTTTPSPGSYLNNTLVIEATVLWPVIVI